MLVVKKAVKELIKDRAMISASAFEKLDVLVKELIEKAIERTLASKKKVIKEYNL